MRKTLMGTTHVITLNYVVGPGTQMGTVHVDPDVTRALPNDTLEFKRTDSEPGTFRITFREKELFATKNPHFSSTGKFFNEDGPVTVKGHRLGRTVFDCDLLDAHGHTIATSTDPGSGGAIEIADH